MDLDQTPSLPETGADTLALVSQVAELNLLFAQQEIGRRIVDPDLPTKVLLELAEHSYKTSGMAKKQEAKTQGSGFSLIINFPEGNQVRLEKVVEHEQVDTAESLLEEVRPIINFGDAPEFVTSKDED
ncbi:MAG: hypothetical protein WBI41_05860 [Azovibrio sp.]|uniref:hypothetical protein n=1 Tax=Azovibrio sp. TaxID=1872673 RepID=UPI003C760F59